MIQLSAIKSKLNLNAVTDNYEDNIVTGGYASDLLSDVLANAKDGQIWITNQKHQNCIAVASLLSISAIIIAGGIEPDANTVEKANAEKVALFKSDISAFDLVGQLYELGLRG